MRRLHNRHAASERLENKNPLSLLIGGGHTEDVDGVEKIQFPLEINFAEHMEMFCQAFP